MSNTTKTVLQFVADFIKVYDFATAVSLSGRIRSFTPWVNAQVTYVRVETHPGDKVVKIRLGGPLSDDPSQITYHTAVKFFTDNVKDVGAKVHAICVDLGRKWAEVSLTDYPAEEFPDTDTEEKSDE